MRPQIGQAAGRRHTAPIASMAVWAALCGAAVIALHQATRSQGAHLGSYRTGIITLITFALAAVYALRKYSLWLSARWLRIASRLPRAIAVRFLLLDRLETWRTLHITLGVFAMLPFWWHTDAGRPSTLEEVLKAVVILMILSGIFGAIIEDFLPSRMLRGGQEEVRIEDVEASLHALYVEAEEAILGHSEVLVQAYLRNVRPILTAPHPARRLAWATLSGADPAIFWCARLRSVAEDLGSENSTYRGLVALAERKIRLEHNMFNLKVGSGWLRIHRGLVIAAGILIAFHVGGVLYFAGI